MSLRRLASVRAGAAAVALSVAACLVGCGGNRPTAKWSTMRPVPWLMTSTVFDVLFGTYTRAGSRRTCGASRFARSAA